MLRQRHLLAFGTEDPSTEATLCPPLAGASIKAEDGFAIFVFAFFSCFFGCGVTLVFVFNCVRVCVCV